MTNENRYKILAVDDEKSNLDVLNHILRDQYDVFLVKSGESALAKAASICPDLILLDVVMPGLNGFDVLTRLRENAETRHIPVIFITGLNSVENEEKGILMGAADYITKPFSPAIVKLRVATQLKILRQLRLIQHLEIDDPWETPKEP